MLGVIPLEYHELVWLQKTRVRWLLCGVVRVIIGSAILIELRLVTDKHRDIAYTALAERRAVKMKTVRSGLYLMDAAV